MAVKLGSVSHGTMRTEDLIPAFLDALAEVAGLADTIRTPEQERVAALVAEIEGRLDANEEEYYDSEEAGWDLDALMDELNACSPPYCHFGANEGDGSDYGFWPSVESVEEDCRYGQVLKVDAGVEWCPGVLAYRHYLDWSRMLANLGWENAVGIVADACEEAGEDESAAALRRLAEYSEPPDYVWETTDHGNGTLRQFHAEPLLEGLTDELWSVV